MTLWEKSKLEACGVVETMINTTLFKNELLYIVYLLITHKAYLCVFTESLSKKPKDKNLSYFT